MRCVFCLLFSQLGPSQSGQVTHPLPLHRVHEPPELKIVLIAPKKLLISRFTGSGSGCCLGPSLQRGQGIFSVPLHRLHFLAIYYLLLKHCFLACESNELVWLDSSNLDKIVKYQFRNILTFLKRVLDLLTRSVVSCIHMETPPVDIEKPTVVEASLTTRTFAPRPTPKTLVVGVIALLVLVSIFRAFTAPSTFPVGGIFSVTSGDSLRSISTSLKDEHYVRSSSLFVTFVTLFGGEHRLAQGDYYFAEKEGVIRIAWKLSHGIHGLDPVKVTFPEGRNVREMGAILSDKIPGFPSDAFIASAEQYEGYLFPSTYFLYPRTDAESVIARLRATWKSQTADVFTTKNLKGRSQKDVVIMASIIEREARGDTDRATIASILWNRIDRGMALQVDASVTFARGIPEGQLQKSDLGFDSPYNTYIYRGLPPGPISNPGIESLQAAMNPTKTEYLYYIHDARGTIHYAKTYAEHQKNINRYLK